MTASRPPPGGASVSDLLATAAQLFRASLLKCLPMGMVAVLCAQAANIYWMATGHVLSFTADYDTNYQLLAIAGIAVVIGLACGFWLGYATLARRVRQKFGGIKVY